MSEAQTRRPGGTGEGRSSTAVTVAPQPQRLSVLLLFAAMLAALLPVFWQPQIEAGDLASHLYNAWLVQLINQGQVHGLWIASQSTNILFDWLLSWLLPLVGAIAAERTAVALAVLVLFSGAFEFASALAGRRAWSALPLVAAIAYGRIFELGFFNFYLSIGLACHALALLLARRKYAAAAAVPLLALAWLAHPVPVLWALGTFAYLKVCHKITFKMLLGAVGVVALIAAISAGARMWRHTADLHSAPGAHLTASAVGARFWAVAGLDNFYLFTRPLSEWNYRWFEAGLLLLVLELIYERRKAGVLRWQNPAVQLWLLAALCTLLMPRHIVFGRFQDPLGFLAERIAFIQCIIACALIAMLGPRKWHQAALLALCAGYFWLLFGDAQRLNAVERALDAQVARAPAGARVAAIIAYPGAREITPLAHMVDRVCIGHCYSYANYEPSTLEFRIRAAPGNGVVLAGNADSVAMQNGDYVVRAEDLPLYQIWPCGRQITDLCLRQLKAGEKNGTIPGAP